MDLNQISELATGSTLLITAFLNKAGEGVAKKAGEAAWDEATNRLARIHQVIKAKFATDEDPYVLKTLEQLEEDPNSAPCRAALAEVLREKVEADQAFSQTLAELVREARQSDAAGQFLTIVSGHAQVKSITNIGSAGVVNINFNDE